MILKRKEHQAEKEAKARPAYPEGQVEVGTQKPLFCPKVLAPTALSLKSMLNIYVEGVNANGGWISLGPIGCEVHLLLFLGFEG